MPAGNPLRRFLSLVPWLLAFPASVGAQASASVLPDPPPVLRKVTIDGLGIVDRLIVRGQLKRLEPIPFDKGSTVTSDLLLTARDALSGTLRARGYLDATATLDATEITSDGLRVTFSVERGPRYRVALTTATGTQNPDPAFWHPATSSIEGKHVTYPRIRQLQDSLERRAQSRGYMAPRVELDLQPVAGESKVNVVARVDEGTTSVLGRVLIDRTPPASGYGESWYHRRVAPPLAAEIIRRQVRARIGQPLDLWALDDSEARLSRLGAFETVEVRTVPTSDTMIRDLKLILRERRTGSLDFTAGWSDTLGPLGGIRLTERNVGGRGDHLSLDLSIHRDGYGGELSYFDRNWKPAERLLGPEREPSLLTSAFSRRRGYREYSETRTGGQLVLGYLFRNLRTPWSNAWSARIEHLSYETNGDDYAEPFNDYIAATLGYHLLRDTRDGDAMTSTRGLLFNSSLEAGAADGPLLQWLTRVEWYRPIARRLTWASAGEFGLMPVDATSVGLGHRFQAGGVDSLRGFDARGLGPVDRDNDRLHIGGSTLLSIQNELRFNLTDRTQLPLFLDFGTLNEDPFSFGSPRAAVGIGGRYFMPDSNRVAYLYLGKAFLREETDDELNLFFGFSFTFGGPASIR